VVGWSGLPNVNFALPIRTLPFVVVNLFRKCRKYSF